MTLSHTTFTVRFVRRNMHLLTIAFFALYTVAFVGALIPATPREQTQRTISSIVNAIEGHRKGGLPLRFYVDYLLPLPVETKAEDIDPWPGGLAQMYPYAEDILATILQGVVDEPAGPCSSQVLSEADCCGFFVQESKTSSRNDVAAILFPGVDQLKSIEEVDAMVGDQRTLILFNKQFQRPSDFGFLNNDRCKKAVFDRFAYGFAFQEFACRGEDVKLTFEYPLWKSAVICEEEGRPAKEIPLLNAQAERPLYEDLEKKINQVLPEPLWMRKMGEAETKGFKFQRGGGGNQG